MFLVLIWPKIGCRIFFMVFGLVFFLFLLPVQNGSGSEDPVPFQRLIQELESPEQQSRWDAIGALGASGDGRAVPYLMEALEKDMKQRKGYAMAIIPALGQLKDERAVPLLVEALNRMDEDWMGRVAAARALGEIGSTKAVPGLIKAAWLPETRSAAIEALARIKDPRAISPLLSALGISEKSEARQAAVEALIDIGKPAVPELIETLESLYSGDHARALAAGILGKIGDPRALDPLRKALDDPNEIVRNYAEKALELMTN